jgi:hypothetical protein
LRAGLASALFGIACGFIDMVHSPTRGAILSIVFSVVAVGVLIAAVPVLRSALWMRHAGRELAPVDPWADDASETVGSGRAADHHGGRASHQSTGSRDRSEA